MYLLLHAYVRYRAERKQYRILAARGLLERTRRILRLGCDGE